MADFGDFLGDVVTAPAKFVNYLAGSTGATSRSQDSRTQVTGVGNIGGDPQRIEDEYQRRTRELLAKRQREDEQAQFAAQQQRILGAMQPTFAATEQARAQALQSGAATLGAARSQGGVGGMQTSALAGLGAGQAQQYGMQAAAQVQAGEEQRNALAQAQLAEMLRQQQLSQFGLQRADYATALGAQRALSMPELEMQQQAAAAEAERQRKMQGALIQAGASFGGQILGGKEK
jgi:hypothetical protein